jgi:anhydro-N-acetylmuramic acid kinase
MDMSEKTVTKSPSSFYIGLMSGTSLDGVDGVIAEFSGSQIKVLAAAHHPFPDALRQDFLALQHTGPNELHREALAGNQLALLYASVCEDMLRQAGLRTHQITAIGAHGQTIRHQPGLHDGIGYTKQTLSAALLAELTGIGVVADLRSRDVAAGGQGAPLVPAFHAACLSAPDQTRAVLNIGGMSNLSILPAQNSSSQSNMPVRGWDCGPGNVLLDAWIHHHQQRRFDFDGGWAATGRIHGPLLNQLLQEPFLTVVPPKSTGRDLFNWSWLEGQLQRAQLSKALVKNSPLAADVQATLVEFTVRCAANDIAKHAPAVHTLAACGGGALNSYLMQRLTECLSGVRVCTTADWGLPVDQVEALAFAWLALRFLSKQTGNLPAVTGARGPRLLGAWYPG